MELMVVVSVMLILAVIAITSLQAVRANGRDKERLIHLNEFAKDLELYKSNAGHFICGDSCAQSAGGDDYSIDCSDSNGGATFGSQPRQVSGFLNGGNCCGGAPVPASQNDDLTWGLYRHGYLGSSWIKDPAERTIGAAKYTYCYATPKEGRGSFALFTRLETLSTGSEDSGLCEAWFEVSSSDYPSDGWVPLGCTDGTYCGDGNVDLGEQCDDGNSNNGDLCDTFGTAPQSSGSCRLTRCRDGAVQHPNGIGIGGTNGDEVCDDGNSNDLDGCTNLCVIPVPPPICGNGIIETGEYCDVGLDGISGQNPNPPFTNDDVLPSTWADDGCEPPPSCSSTCNFCLM